MRAVLFASIALGSALHTACIAGNGGAAVFPARYDVAPVTASTDGVTERGIHCAAGLSWASWSSSSRTPMDAVLGYSIESFGASEAAPPAGALQKTVPEPDGARLVHGPFVEIARRIAGDSTQRLWGGVKTEILFDSRADRDGAGLGVAARLGWELFRGLKKSTRSAGVEGVLAIGLFAEAGVRAGPAGDTSTVGLGGLSVRVPAAGAR